LDDSRVLGEIVDELLASAQLAVDPSHGEPIEIEPLLSEVARSMSVLADIGRVKLIVVVANAVQVNGSRVALRRAMTALVDNSLGHTPPGGSVTLAATVVDDRLVLSVTDTGEGLGELNPEELTRRFARGTQTANGPGGRRFGLGLALVREVAVAHGGTLTLGADQGGGARAEIGLPWHP
jgi:signal transduction histidine kinase